jgi:cytosine/adenosine deaminase-related metal-dependent hydrolase
MIRINNVHTIDDDFKSLIIDNTKISSVSFELHFDNAIAFPGLINSHDHLEFNLFPQLGNKTYKSYMEWGRDIHEHDKEIIQSILQIPKELRAKWGMYKNLLAGITTVVQHGARLLINNDIINIFQNCYSLHSVRLEKLWKLKLNKPFAKNQPYAIHIGEGTDDDAFKEINELIRWNLFKRKLVGIHGIAMNTQQAKAFEALVWCPDSNFFLCNATAPINELKNVTKILFGTDSTLSAGWNIWEQLRIARNTGMLTDMELYESLTRTPSLVWNLPERGSLTENKKADIVIAKIKDKTDILNGFFSLNPEDILMIFKDGEIILFDETILAQLTKYVSIKEFSKIFINGTCKFIKGNLPALIKHIKQYNAEIKFPVEIDEK